MPEIFVSSDMDLILTGTRNTTTKPASAVKTINGKPAVEYMTQAAKDFFRSFIDSQADWNQLFSNSAAENSGSHSPFEAVSYYPGYTNFTLTFTNGTTVTEEWTAATLSDFTDVMNAPYPAPAAVQEVLGAGGFITGYFLNRSSTAVLSLPSFHFEGEIAQLTAASTIAEFLAKCKAGGMKRLVIDLQANGGGLIDALFPTTMPFAGSQLRLPPSAELMGLTRGSANASMVAQNVSATYYYGTYLNFEGKGFPNWPSVINQQTQKGDKFTNTLRVNFTKTDQVLEAQGINTQRAPQYFAAKDILLLTDGRCSSTCAIFAEEMHQVGVKIVVAGGRPEPGPMQGVRSIREINSSLPASCFPANGSSPFSGDAKSNVINLRNQIRKSQQDVPLHFVYQTAECRFFYTAKMLTDYSVLWQYAADALWSNQGLCAQGSTNHTSSGINVTTITGVGKNDGTNGTTSTTNVSFTGSGNSNGGLNAALLSGAMVCFALLLL
ncbi:hypothetical protein HYALB_00004752 [Hymenoscyphus albidus]|uniref:Tail specific protease domain-containing protein n=1 Tax=Hymenoscyphus albidus TaxID=595503 RepID=A0A9N9QB71_9HELO|nr:hypothetical protein HYALB_00004752 [Hymenoscyphus albidus]